MKKIIGLTIVLIWALSAQAQEGKIGLRVGYQHTMMKVDGSKIGSAGNSFFLNVYKDTRIIPFLFFHSGLQYSQAKADINDNNYTLNYLGVPIGLKAKIGPLYGLAGATFNAKISEKNSPYGDAKWYDTNTFVGLGFSMLMLSIEGRYAWGMTDINSGIHNDAFQIGVGVRF